MTNPMAGQPLLRGLPCGAYCRSTGKPCRMSRVPGRSLKEVARWPLTDKPRRFTPPWDIEDNGACFIVRDHSVSRLGQAPSRQRPRKPLARSGRGKNTAWTLQRNHQGLAVGKLAMERTNAGSPVAPPHIGRSSVIEPRLSPPSSPPSPLPKTRRTLFLAGEPAMADVIR